MDGNEEKLLHSAAPQESRDCLTAPSARQSAESEPDRVNDTLEEKARQLHRSRINPAGDNRSDGRWHPGDR